MSFNLIKKISVKTVCGVIDKTALTKEPTILMRVMGVAKGIKTGSSTYGEWAAFTGTFEATDLISGEVSRSGVAFLPDVAFDLIAPLLVGDEANGVEFAFDIGVKSDDKVAVGYTYVAMPLVELTEADPIRQLQSKVKALPSPKKESKK